MIIGNQEYWSMRKSDLPLDFIVEAKKGDAVLNRCIIDLLGDYDITGTTKQRVLQYLNSNKMLENFEQPMRHTDPLIKQCLNDDCPKVHGDTVEAYIGFLYTNYGYDSAKRYILKQFKNSIDEIRKELREYLA